GTEVDCFVRHAWRDKQKVSGLADEFVLERVTPAREHCAIQDIDARLVADMDVRFGPRARRDDHEVHGKTCRTHRGARYANEVGQALPGHDFAIRPEALYFAVGVVHGFSNVGERFRWHRTLGVSLTLVTCPACRGGSSRWKG